MLQIKKQAKLTSLQYFLQVLLKSKQVSCKFRLKKKLSQSITLRAPKHFNIGKHKVYSLNYKTLSLIIRPQIEFHMGKFSSHSNFLYLQIKKFIQTNTFLQVRSVKMRVKTQFKIKWLEY